VRTRRSYRAIVSVSAAAVVALLISGTALAHNVFDPNDRLGSCTEVSEGAASTVCMADNQNHYVYYALGPMLTRATDATLYGSYDTTAINVFKDGGHYASTDVYYYNETELPVNVLGRTSCIHDSTSDVHDCDHFHVGYHSDRLNELGWNVDTTQNRTRLHALACHESGHTVGLTHGGDAGSIMANDDPALRCMRTPLVETDTGVGTHNADHLNNSSHYR
jgi:hypothetical protein